MQNIYSGQIARLPRPPPPTANHTTHLSTGRAAWTSPSTRSFSPRKQSQSIDAPPRLTLKEEDNMKILEALETCVAKHPEGPLVDLLFDVMNAVLLVPTDKTPAEVRLVARDKMIQAAMDEGWVYCDELEKEVTKLA